MGGESPQKRRLSAAQANVKKPVPEKRGSLPNLLPPLSKRRHDMATKVLPDDPKAAAAPITLPDVATPASAPKGDTLKLPDAPAKATKPAPSASSIKRYKSSQRTIDTVLKYQSTCDIQTCNRHDDGVVRSFTAYVHVVYVVGQCELRKLKEVFNYIDVEYVHSEFAKLANMVNDGKPLFTGNFNRALKEFDKSVVHIGSVIDFTGFDLLNRRYPMILFPCFRLQDRIQKATLGEAHWLRIHQRYYDMLKDDLFRKKHGGAAPPVSTSTKIKLIFGVGTFEVYQPV
ncbi:hypothetical protein B5M09_000703 [Aphanomyces astaci]|uniref:Uncharacterized protein n=1 Tax=Aphanomyces astaci TaxID=112090 RepID=A0A3R7ZAA0_APHAT|nr:hypothetical protein B5M09_000703 [Aphanomyces astaci]